MYYRRSRLVEDSDESEDAENAEKNRTIEKTKIKKVFLCDLCDSSVTLR